MDQDLERIGKDLEEMYGDDLPNPEHCPKQFAYILKLYMYYRGENVNN